MASRSATVAEWAAMNSPTILLQASATSVSCNLSLRPSRCMRFGKMSAGAAHRLCVTVFPGKPRHSAIILARSDDFIRIRFLDFAKNNKIDNRRSVTPTHVARQNIQLGAVLGHRAPRDRNAALTQDLYDLLVAERRITGFR